MREPSDRSVSDLVKLVVVPEAKRINDVVSRDVRCLWGEVIEHHAGAKHHLLLMDTDTDKATIRATLPSSLPGPELGDVVGIHGVLRARPENGNIALVFDGHALSPERKSAGRRKSMDALLASLADSKRSKIRQLRKIILVSSATSKAVSDFHSNLTDDVRAQIEVDLVVVELLRSNSIAEGVLKAASRAGADLVIVMRGGGDVQKLLLFSTPEVVKAVADAAQRARGR